MSHGLDQILRYFFLALLWLFFLYAARMVISDVVQNRAVRRHGADPRAPKRQSARLRVTGPPGLAGRSFELEAEATVGRSSGCEVTLDEDTYASSVHARLYEDGGDWWVEDLGSTNGTYLNDDLLDHPARVRRGDEIRIGSTSFELIR